MQVHQFSSPLDHEDHDSGVGRRTDGRRDLEEMLVNRALETDALE